MGIQKLAMETDQRRYADGWVPTESAAYRISVPSRVVAPLGALLHVPYAAHGAERVCYDPLDPWSAPRPVGSSGVFEALADSDPSCHRLSAWWAGTNLRRTTIVEGWQRPFLLIERDGRETFEPALLPRVCGFKVDLVWVQRNVCSLTPPVFDEWPVLPVVSGPIVLARLRAGS